MQVKGQVDLLNGRQESYILKEVVTVSMVSWIMFPGREILSSALNMVLKIFF